MAPITTEDVIAIHDFFTKVFLEIVSMLWCKSVFGNLKHAMVCIRLDLVILFFIFLNS